MTPTSSHTHTGPDELLDVAREKATKAASKAAQAYSAWKPKLRGWFHAGTAPLALAYGVVITILAPAGAPRVTVAVFAAATVLLFGVSAVYHRGHWTNQVAAVLRRLDHANIFLVIAGTYTSLKVLLLPKATATALLSTVWAGSIAELLMR